MARVVEVDELPPRHKKDSYRSVDSQLMLPTRPIVFIFVPIPQRSANAKRMRLDTTYKLYVDHGELLLKMRNKLATSLIPLGKD